MPKTRLPVGMPRQELPYPAVQERHGKMALAIMEQRYEPDCRAATAKAMKPEEFTWTLEWQRAKDPDCSDQEAFLSYLVANSKFYLVARGGKWVGSEEFGAPPPQILSRLKEHARLACRIQELEEPVDRVKEKHKHNDDTDIFDPPPSWGIMLDLEVWLEKHPNAHPGLARLAKVAIQELVESIKE